MNDVIYTPNHYTNHDIETIDVIEYVISEMSGANGYKLGNILEYTDRAPYKGKHHEDMTKANNYAHRLCTGSWAIPDTIKQVESCDDVAFICAGLPSVYAKLLGCTIRYALGKGWTRDLEKAKACAILLDTEIKHNSIYKMLNEQLPRQSWQGRSYVEVLSRCSNLPNPFDN